MIADERVEQLTGKQPRSLPFSLYIHIPFCAHKCPYCDFNTYAVGPQIPEDEYLAALAAELDFRAAELAWSGRSIATIFFGGGSPSLLSARGIVSFLGLIRRFFSVDENAEISIEVNPNDPTPSWFSEIRRAGVNRVSLGAQSFNDELLKKLGRTHSAAQISSTISAARAAGFDNCSVDLMFGIPGQTTELFTRDLHEAIALKTPHLSLYGLTIEPGTPFFQSSKRRVLKLPSEQLSIEMMDKAEELLPEAGSHRYEISNYSAPNFEARHNLAYWTRGDYLGIGAGAHSFCSSVCEEPKVTEKSFGRRWSNIAPFQLYRDHVAAFGKAESWEENLTQGNAIFEELLLGLRLTSGISGADWPERYAVSLTERYGTKLSHLEKQGLLQWDSGAATVSVTSRGLRVFDSLIEEFLE